MPRISFFKAARRLHSDGLYLANDASGDRSHNAGHFFGLAAECGLKYLLILCGGLTRDAVTGDLCERPRPHVDKLIDASGLATNYRTLVGVHPHAQYFTHTPALAGLHSWKAEFRYYDASHPDYPAASENDWQNASREIQSALDAAMLDGHPFY